MNTAQTAAQHAAMTAIHNAQEALRAAGNHDAAREISSVLDDAQCSCDTWAAVLGRVDANISDCSAAAQDAYYAAMRTI